LLGPVASTVLLAAVTAAPAGPVPKSDPDQVRKEMDAAWVDLLSENEQTAGLAVLRLAARSDEAAAYLKEKLRPLKLTKERADKLIENLVNKDARVARAAYEELGYYDPRLALGDKDLRDALLEKPASRRLSEVLCDLPMDAMAEGRWHWYSPDNKVFRFNVYRGGDPSKDIYNLDTAISAAKIGTVGRKATWARATRAVAVLEFIGTPSARGVLEQMAGGDPHAAPTQAARLARDRLKK
jgi:hypothetical protein